jgi:hypothetical protein
LDIQELIDGKKDEEIVSTIMYESELTPIKEEARVKHKNWLTYQKVKREEELSVSHPGDEASHHRFAVKVNPLIDSET